MKIWITTYALTAGIREAEAEICDKINSDMIRVVGEHRYVQYFHGEGKVWHRTREDAVKRAKAMQEKKISSLLKQIDKIKKLRFD